MSHDRKPGRARVLSDADETPQRRRDDGAPVVVDGAAPAPAAAGAPVPARSGKGKAMLALLFLLGAIGGGVAMTMAGLA